MRKIYYIYFLFFGTKKNCVAPYEENRASRKGLISPIVVCPAPFKKGSLATGAWSLIMASNSWVLKPSGFRSSASTRVLLGALWRWSPFINMTKSNVLFSLSLPQQETKSMASFHMWLLRSKCNACVSWPAVKHSWEWTRFESVFASLVLNTGKHSSTDCVTCSCFEKESLLRTRANVNFYHVTKFSLHLLFTVHYIYT